MHHQREKILMSRAVELGNSGNAAAVPELLNLLNTDSGQVRRLSASALGKLAGIANPAPVIPALQNRLRDNHPQVRQYAVKALSAYGANAKIALHDITDIANNPNEKEYNIRDAQLAIDRINEAIKIKEKHAIHHCQKCDKEVTAEEFARSTKTFQRIFCDKCFDEVYLKRRNFDTNVELNKNIKAKDGTLVQSHGERIISEFLSSNSIAFRYDERIRIIEGMAIRPDFYLPEFDVYIEYWGMDTINYKIGMLKKQKLYQQEGKKLISLYYYDKDNLKEILRKKLSRYIKI
ncbi:MAG: hypothetical protein DRI94_15235 [Bacteroidetes bacterium]|nr:MAG: hypothetical protein DRI94_15235 [Bacteroidota bacterium]